MAQSRVCYTIHRDLFRDGIGCPADRVGTRRMGIQYAIRPARGSGIVNLRCRLGPAEIRGGRATRVLINGMSSHRTGHTRSAAGINPTFSARPTLCMLT